MKKKKLSELIQERWANNLQKQYRDWVIPYLTNRKPLTKRQLAKYEKERKVEALKEKRRRAKKIILTIGELEDKLSEERNRYEDY